MARGKGQSRWADVPDIWQDELSDATLREMAGDEVFQRGLAYFAEGRVSLARDGGGNATFHVAGTHRYATELYFEDVGLHVDCSCPQGQEGHFCKHMVAAALCWRQHLGGEVAPATAVEDKSKSERTAKAQQTKARKQGELQAFVASRDAVALSALLWQWAERDRHLMAELKMWAAGEQASADPAQLHKALDAALVSTSKFLAYRDTFAYAQRARKALPLLEQALHRSAGQALAAAEHALRRLYRVAAQADDSGGVIGDLMHEGMNIARKALAKEPPPAAWAERFLALLDDDPYGLWDVDAVLAAAGPEVAERYGKVLSKRWSAIEAGRGQGDANKVVSWGMGGQRTEADYERDRIRRLLVAELKRQDDVPAAIDFMKKTAQRDHEWVEAVVYCEAQGRGREALALAEAANKASPGHWQIEDALLRCWERDGWDEKVYALRKQRYWQRPHLENYAALLRAAQAAKQPLDALRAEVETLLIEREKAVASRTTLGWRSTTSSNKPDVSDRAQWLLFEKRAGDALALVCTTSTCHPQVLMQVAAAADKAHDAQAFALIDRVARHEVQHSTGRYDEAVDAVKLACGRLDDTAARQYLARLKAEFKAKRNFVKALDALSLPNGAA